VGNGAEKAMGTNEYIWETFDGLFKTVHRQGRLVEALEARVRELERRLNEAQKAQAGQQLTAVSEMPTERRPDRDF